MRTLFTLLGLLSYFMTYAQVCGFEIPEAMPSEYTDTGDASLPHALLDNPDEPYLNWPSEGNEMGFTAHYVPYDDPDVGLTDGDKVGVTNATGIVDNYTEGSQGYVFSDVDGNFILEFEPVTCTSSSPVFSIDYFIAETGYEGDGTVNATGSDRFRIYVRFLEEGTEFDVLNTTGSDINDLGIEGQWIHGSVPLPSFSGTEMTFQVVIEARNNSSSEAFFIDNLAFNFGLNTERFKDESYRIVPNPAGEFLQLVGLEYGSSIGVEIFDILGKKVLQCQSKEHTLSIATLPSGMYFIKVTREDQQLVGKLMKR